MSDRRTRRKVGEEDIERALESLVGGEPSPGFQARLMQRIEVGPTRTGVRVLGGLRLAQPDVSRGRNRNYLSRLLRGLFWPVETSSAGAPPAQPAAKASEASRTTGVGFLGGLRLASLAGACVAVLSVGAWLLTRPDQPRMAAPAPQRVATDAGRERVAKPIGEPPPVEARDEGRSGVARLGVPRPLLPAKVSRLPAAQPLTAPIYGSTSEEQIATLSLAYLSASATVPEFDTAAETRVVVDQLRVAPLAPPAPLHVAPIEVDSLVVERVPVPPLALGPPGQPPTTAKNR